MITAVMDAHAGRDVAVCNIIGVYLSADMDEEVIIILEGCLRELTAMVAPYIYCPQIHLNSNSKKVMYVKLKKVLCSCLKSMLLFYQKIYSDLKKK